MNAHSTTCPDTCDAACECMIPSPVFGNVTKYWYCYTCGHDLKNKATGYPFVNDRVGARPQRMFRPTSTGLPRDDER